MISPARLELPLWLADAIPEPAPGEPPIAEPTILETVAQLVGPVILIGLALLLIYGLGRLVAWFEAREEAEGSQDLSLIHI